ncbi:MAG: aldo/keto reductase [Defluviitaleaceae bacterium]|nr:aldo/keto reductase [Defluviitaleaceae bacterium]
MQYREDKASGNQLSALGMGCMRFPMNKKESEALVLAAIEGGVNFFDTAYIYPGSEVTLGEILAKHNKRKDVYIATKLPIVKCKSPADFDRLFEEQLKRLKTDYVDYYFMHAVSSYSQWKALQEMGIENWLAKKKASGQIRQVGFSYHGTCDDFLEILDSYPWTFCMIQYNYYDENYQAGKKGLMAAVAKGMSVFIMEPLLGGGLATGLPKQAAEMLTQPDMTPADWALWWLWNQPEVTVVVSGMRSIEILNANIKSADAFRPLTQEELAVYPNVVEIFRKTYKYNCTGCNYCLPCPKGINIPACLTAYNTSFGQGYVKGITLYATTTAVITKKPNTPRNCNNCGHCERHCPQGIPIRAALKKVARRFEPLPLRPAYALIRKIIGG